MQITATEAKNRFGCFCAKAKNEPVFIEKDGRLDSVILSFETFQSLKADQAPLSFAERKRQFEEPYKDWIDEQNRMVETYGVFGENHRPW
jgi:PHD/YefM family antitoxin component YafN of YafNO toxin-antitoxin module